MTLLFNNSSITATNLNDNINDNVLYPALPTWIILLALILHISVHKLQLGHVDIIERPHVHRPFVGILMIRIRQTTVY